MLFSYYYKINLNKYKEIINIIYKNEKISFISLIHF